MDHIIKLQRSVCRLFAYIKKYLCMYVPSYIKALTYIDTANNRVYEVEESFIRAVSNAILTLVNVYRPTLFDDYLHRNMTNRKATNCLAFKIWSQHLQRFAYVLLNEQRVNAAMSQYNSQTCIDKFVEMLCESSDDIEIISINETIMHPRVHKFMLSYSIPRNVTAKVIYLLQCHASGATYTEPYEISVVHRDCFESMYDRDTYILNPSSDFTNISEDDDIKCD